MKTICFALILCGFCSSAQIITDSLDEKSNGYEKMEEDTLLPEEDNSRDEAVVKSKRKNYFLIGLKLGAGVTSGVGKQEKDMLSPGAGALAYFIVTKRSAFGLDFIYCNDFLVALTYRWMYENWFLKGGTYYTNIVQDEAINNGSTYQRDFEVGLHGSIGYQFNQMKVKPFMEFQLFGLEINSRHYYLFLMSGGVMF